MYRYCSKHVKFDILRISETCKTLNYKIDTTNRFCTLLNRVLTRTSAFVKVMSGEEENLKVVQSCKMPQIKPDFVGDDRWSSMHRRFVAETRSSEAEVLFLGDSIIQQMQFTSLWMEKINPLHSLNFGIGGDRVEHVLWRVLNGELAFTAPIKAVVLLVGTNNTDCSPQDIFEGICEIVKVIKLKLGDVIIILPTLLPRGQYPNANRERNLQVNALLINNFQPNSSDANLKNVHVMPIHEDILQGDQTISHHIMYDYLHLTNHGYSKIFKPVYEKLEELLHPNNAVA